jgi:hypothetical protein
VAEDYPHDKSTGKYVQDIGEYWEERGDASACTVDKKHKKSFAYPWNYRTH